MSIQIQDTLEPEPEEEDKDKEAGEGNGANTEGAEDTQPSEDSGEDAESETPLGDAESAE